MKVILALCLGLLVISLAVLYAIDRRLTLQPRTRTTR